MPAWSQNAGNEFPISYPGQGPGLEIEYTYELGRISAIESVYENATSANTISSLRWSGISNGFANARLKGASDRGFLFSAKGSWAQSPWAQMDDYDWFGPDFRSYSFDDWTHHSSHEDTSIDWYFSGELAAGYRIEASEFLNLDLDLRAKYVTLKWTSNGGSYVYSDTVVDNSGDNFRSYRGTLPEQPAISYQQNFPALQFGVATDLAAEGIHLQLESALGLTLGATATDTHWMRNLVFEDQFQPAAILTLGANFEYEFENWALVLGITHEKIFNSRGDETILENGVPIAAGNLDGTVGTSLEKTGLRFGVRKHF